MNVCADRPQGRCWAALAMGAVLCCCASDLPAGTVIEGFEDLKKVKVTDGNLSAVADAKAVSEGKQAAQLRPGSAVVLTAAAKDLDPRGWLRVDTVNGQAEPMAIELSVACEGTTFRQKAYVQPGRDTLSLPLNWPLAPRVQWPAQQVQVTIANASTFPLVLDNMRAEPPAPPPADCVLLDFGDDEQVAWPGFAATGPKCPHVVWSGERDIRANSDPLPPDPLGGDFIGPGLSDRATDTVSIESPARESTAWLWVTHYADGYYQPMEWAIRLGNRVLAGERLGAAQMLSPRGLLEGMDGEWTPQWFDQVQAKHYVSLVSFPVRPGANRLTLGNCQIAAMALAPTPQAKEMEQYVQQVGKDLSRFRRQFVVGRRIDPRCTLEPNETEQADGLMVFPAGDDAAYRADWAPTDPNRIAVLRTTVANGQAVAVPLAVVPLKRSTVARTTLSTLRSEAGRPLNVDRARTGVQFVERVPVVRDAAVGLQPWLLVDKYAKAETGEVVWAVLTVAVDPRADAGVYRGSMRLSFSSAQANLPVEITVRDLGGASADPPVVVPFRFAADAHDYFRSLAGAMSEADRRSLTTKIHQELLADGVNGLFVPTVGLDTKFAVLDAPLAQALAELPAPLSELHLLLDPLVPLYRLRTASVEPGTRKHAAAFGEALSRSFGMARQAGVGDCLFWGGYAESEDGLKPLSRIAAEAPEANGRGMVWIVPMRSKEADDLLAPFGAVMFSITADTPAAVEHFRSTRPTGRAWLYQPRPDRFTTGFYAAALGATGGCFYGVATARPPYCGFGFDGAGLLCPRPDRSLAPTLGLHALRMGSDDYRLIQRCRKIAESAKQAKVDAAALTRLLAELDARARKAGTITYVVEKARGSGMSRTEMESLRQALTDAAAETLRNLHSKSAGGS